MRLRDLLRRLDRCTSGISILETAIVLPVILVVIGGIFDFGRAYATLSAAQKSLWSATRYLSHVPYEQVCSSWALADAKNIALYGNTAGTGPLLVTGWTAGDITLNAPTNCNNPVVAIRMSANVPYLSFMWGVVGLPERITMTAEHEERWIGQ
ncbi:MAG: TadE/TadG family type IV pilus assembly protein [Aestuariivirga sp.]|uniref:TadE/TadG family type IV pilus assembly protein n=1 Tax=Aestuariivirga sp. TaxID=2650926 RepID=UPI00301A1F30